MDKFVNAKKKAAVSVEPASKPKKAVNVGGGAAEFKLSGLEYPVTTVARELESGAYDPLRPPFLTDKVKNVPFFFIAETLNYVSTIKGASSVARKKQALNDLFSTFLQHEPENLARCFLFLTIRLGSDWSKLVTGVGKEIIKKAVKVVLGVQAKELSETNNKCADLAEFFEQSKSGQGTIKNFFGSASAAPKKLSFETVFVTLRRLADISGTSSQTDKEAILVELLRAVGPIEGKYIIRFITGNMCIGAAEKVVLISLSHAFCLFYSTNNYEWDSNQSTPSTPICNMSLEKQLKLFDREMDARRGQGPEPQVIKAEELNGTALGNKAQRNGSPDAYGAEAADSKAKTQASR